MTSTDLSARDRDIRMLHWTDQGDSDWSATAPGGWDLYYAGARFGLRRGYSRYTSTVTLTRRGKAPASLVREGAFDRLAKRIGYAVEPQTGDADFDRRVYLITDDDALARALGDSPEARRAVLDLLDLDISRIDVTGNGFTIRLGESADPENDGGGALSNLALHLDALSDAWPDPSSAAGSRRGSGLGGLGIGWFCVVAAAVFGFWAWGGDQAWDQQIETFADTDWLGMGLLAAVAVGPYALLGGRRANSHRALALMTTAILALMPLSQRFLQIEVNRLHARSWTLAPAVPTALRPDPDRQYSKGYLLDATVEDRPVVRALSLDEGKLALEGRLCLTGVVIEGLRGLRYVKGVRTWTCRPGEISPVPPPSPAPPAEDAS